MLQCSQKYAVQSKSAALGTRAQAEARIACKGNIDGHILVGFGPYSHMSRQALLQSTKQEHKAYVQSIIRHPVTHPGARLDKLKQYLMKELDKERADDEALLQCVEDMEQRNKSDGMVINFVATSFSAHNEVPVLTLWL